MITFEHVSFTYPGSQKTLEDLSFHIGKGEKTALIGANGAGKSTIMKSVLGLVFTDGLVKVGDYPVNKDNLAAVRKTAGYVLQDSDNQMFMPTVLEDMIFGPVNYGMSRADAERKADEILERLDISYLKNRHNHRISGGEKRMAAIATILMMEPEVLLMDEPSASLDPKNRRRLISILNSLEDITLVIATHDLELVRATCSRVLLINKGRLAADGPCDSILNDTALLEANDL